MHFQLCSKVCKDFQNAKFCKDFGGNNYIDWRCENSGPGYKVLRKTTFFYRVLPPQEKKMLLYMLIAFASAGTNQFQPYTKSIPIKNCALKNRHNCARSFNHNFGTQESRAVCTAMSHQAGCCDFYIKRSRKILF